MLAHLERAISAGNESKDDLVRALAAFERLLPSGCAITQTETLDRYGRSTAPRDTRPAAVLYPHDTAAVQEIVRIAARFGVPLYPISKGKNWGYGDACAPRPGQIIVDLGRMNRIVEVNERLAYAVIEPGVTQGQLFEHLRAHHPGLWMDCTGAGPDASLVGNTLERGFGHTPYADHFAHTCGMDVVLADGRLLHTGFGHYANSKAARVFPYGVGPSLDGLFAQSNLGIVTRIGLWLMPRPEVLGVVLFTADDNDALADIIDRLAPLRLTGVLRSAVHVGNDLRLLGTRTRYPWHLTGGKTPLPEAVRRRLRAEHGVAAWTGSAAIYGSRAAVAVARRAVKRALAPYRPVFIDDRLLAWAERGRRWLGWFGWGKAMEEQLRPLRPLLGLLQGEPSLEPLRGTAWRVRGPYPETPVDPRDVHAGLIWVSPVLPIAGAEARTVLGLIEPIFAEHGFETPVTFTLLNERSMVCVANLAFDKREAAETARAAACYDAVMDRLIGEGYVPYRTGPAGFGKIARKPSVFWDVARQLKDQLDPRNILSPGRYIPGGCTD